MTIEVSLKAIIHCIILINTTIDLDEVFFQLQ